MNAITSLSTSVTRNFPARAKGTKRSVSSVETGHDGSNTDTRFYCNGVHIDQDNWKNCITKDNKEKIPFLVRKMIGFCRDKPDFNPSKRNERNNPGRRRNGRGNDREVSEANTTNDDTPPKNGDNNTKVENDVDNMSKDNTANQSGTKFGNRGRSK